MKYPIVKLVVAAAAIIAISASAWASFIFEFSSISRSLQPYGNVSPRRIWTTHKVAVCWDNPKDVSSNKLRLVQDAIANSWETAGNIEFNGWQECTADTQSGLHVYWLDDGSPPETKGVGSTLDHTPRGITLNPTFNLYGHQHCSGRVNDCIKSDAIHEFGHALGLLHESLRDDAPQACKKLPQVIADHSGTLDASTERTAYDAASVMNYCNKMQGVSLELSQGDRQVITIMYGLPLK